MFGSGTPDLSKKTQEIENNDIRAFGKNHGWTEEEIESCIHNTYLRREIVCYRELLCDDEEILEALLNQGFERSEIEKMLKRYSVIERR